MAAKKKRKPSGGLSPQTFGGLSKKRMKKTSNPNSGKRVIMKKGDTVIVQFLTDPDDSDGFIEFEQHSFREDGRWQFIPCAGEDCPLCADDDDDRSYAGYRFAALVFNHKERKVQVLEGPKDLAQRIFYKYEKKPERFRKRVYEVTKFPTQPVSYQVDSADEKALNPRSMERIDLEDYLLGEMKRYYGDDFEATAVSSLEDEDWDGEEDEFDLELEDDELELMDDDEFEEDDDDSDFDEEPPRKRKKSSSTSSKKASAAKRRRRR